jgi:uncharacterized protein (TIGR02466 family)
MQLHSIFPVPVAHHAKLIGPDTTRSLLKEAHAQESRTNGRDASLSHSQFVPMTTLDPSGLLDYVLVEAVSQFGALLLGEKREWTIKESWVNVMEPGGSQGMHLHANSMVSGVLYLTEVHESARLVFHKPEGGQFVLSNFHEQASVTEYNAPRRQIGETSAGDLVLFPSHLLHSVPANAGSQRVSIAFNAIPDRLSAWGYEISLA